MLQEQEFFYYYSQKFTLRGFFLKNPLCVKKFGKISETEVTVNNLLHSFHIQSILEITNLAARFSRTPKAK